MMSRRIGLSVLVSCLLYTIDPGTRSHSGTLGCMFLSTVHAGPAREKSVAAPAAAALRLKFSIESPLASGEIRRLLPGEVLASGDRLAAKIEVSGPAYVYLVRSASTSQPASVLFPSNGADEQLQPKQQLRIPSGTDWFKLGTSNGRIYVTVIASQTPLSVKGIQAAEEKSTPLTQKTASKGSNQGTDRQQNTKNDSTAKRDKPCDSKGQDDCKRGPDDIFEADADSRGLVVLRFPLRQQ